MKKKHISSEEPLQLTKIEYDLLLFFIKIKVLFYRGTGLLTSFGAWIMMGIIEQSIRISVD